MSEFEAAKRRILAAVPLPELIGEVVKLTRRSGRPVGLCPFHQERSPSFHVYEDHYFCFGCKVHGDAITFVREQRGLSFMEALRYLAERYAINVPELERSANERRNIVATANLFGLHAAAQEFFVRMLWSKQGEEARTYLQERGFADDHIREFGFGLSPNARNGLVFELSRKGFRGEDMIAAALATGPSGAQEQRPASTSPGADVKYVTDFFRNRIMVPIRDKLGRAIAFGGRTRDGSQPKYINSRESALFDKSTTVFGLDRARDNIRAKHRAIVVEGYMDVLQLWAGGIGETVACMGTALTLEQLQEIHRSTSQVILMFDGDNAGTKATLNSVTTAIALPDLTVRVALLPSGHDPDTFLRQQGRDELEKLLENAPGLLDFAVTSRLRVVGPLGMANLIRQEFIPWLLSVRDPMARGILKTRIASAVGLSPLELEQEMRRSEVQARAQQASANSNVPTRERETMAGSRADREEEKALRVATTLPTRVVQEFISHLYYALPTELDLPEARKLLESDLEMASPWLDLAQEFLQSLTDAKAPHEQPISAWTNSADPVVEKFFTSMRDLRPAFVAKDRRAQLALLVQTVQRVALKERIQFLKQRLGATHLVGDKAEMDSMWRGLQELTTQLQDLERRIRQSSPSNPGTSSTNSGTMSH